MSDPVCRFKSALARLLADNHLHFSIVDDASDMQLILVGVDATVLSTFRNAQGGVSEDPVLSLEEIWAG